MTATRLPTDRQMLALRLAGKFTCRCNLPAPFRLGMYGAVECHQCWKPIYPHTVNELIEAVLDEVDQ